MLCSAAAADEILEAKEPDVAMPELHPCPVVRFPDAYGVPIAPFECRWMPSDHGVDAVVPARWMEEFAGDVRVVHGIYVASAVLLGLED